VFDGSGDFTLVLGTNAASGAAYDFAPFGNIPSKHFNFSVGRLCFLFAKRAILLNNFYSS